MKWKRKVNTKPYPWHERIIEKFLFLPVCIGEDCRWLEKAKIKQRYEYTDTREHFKYVNKEWID